MPALSKAILQTHNKRIGHPWVYKSQIKKIVGDPKPGDAIAVHSSKDTPIGTGYYNPKSEIAIRLLCRSEEKINKDFFVRRLQKARAYREKLAIASNALRWVNSESDQLPGLIVDQYADVIVLQFLTLGMDKRREMIVQAAEQVFSPRAIYERSDGAYRRLEGLDIRKGWIRGEGAAKIQIEENGILFWVDMEQGHKTGFYTDQRDSRAFAWDAKGKRVLDCFCYTGAFALALAKRGAEGVLGLDISKEALSLAAESAALNGLAQCAFLEKNAFDHLRLLEQEGETFDAVILDPPSFTRSKGALENAMKGYKEINLRAMKLLRPGGLLLTFCCSHHVSLTDFQEMLLDAARDARCQFRILQWFTQAKDHPILLSVPETYYLKGLALERI